MDEPKINILLVTDDAAHTALIHRAFAARTKPVNLTAVLSLKEAHASLTHTTPDLVLIDFLLPDGTGLAFLDAHDQAPPYPVIVMLPPNHEPAAVDVIKAGALDYLLKSESALLEMPHIVDRTLREWHHIMKCQQAEQALQESEQRFRSLVEQSADGIILTDEQGKIIEWNAGAARISGLEQADVQGHWLWELPFPLCQGDPEQAKQELHHFFDTGELPWANALEEIQFQHADGSTRIIETLTFPIKKEKGFMAASILRDVTESRQAKERIQQQDRLAAVGQLAAGLAHDFNNIMAVIVLYAQISLRVPALPAKVQQRLQTIVTQAQKAATLIEQILDFSRRSVLEKRPLDLLPLIKEQVKLLERTLPENINLSFTHQPDSYFINADPARVQQALLNLAFNARDSMPTGGSLHVTLQRIHLKQVHHTRLSQIPPGEWVQLQVIDNGTGISPEILPHLFEPFFTTKTPNQGTGLGLAQVYGIIKQHKGHIDVHTHYGHGTTFTLYFPARPITQEHATLVDMINLPQGQGEFILVVEDNTATQEALRESLKLLNYHVIAVANGQEALTFLARAKTKPHLILSDIVMPEMGGIELFYALREKEIEIPVVFITGHPLGAELENLKTRGLVEQLTKPPSLDQLAQTIARTIPHT